MWRGFDYDQFFSRLEALWVGRKIAVAQGRREDAARQAELLRVFCDEEGVVRLRGIADALLIEAKAEQRLSFSKEKTILVDDTLEVLKTAERFGIKYLIYKARSNSKVKPILSKEYMTILDFSELKKLKGERLVI